MATHSSVLAWRIPGTGEPDGLPSLGSHRVGHDWSDLAAAAAKRSVVAEVVDSSCSAEYYNSWYMLLYFCPNPECKTPLGKHNVNYRLWVMMLCQCRFINCNKWPFCHLSVAWWGMLIMRDDMCMWRQMYIGNFCPFPSVCLWKLNYSKKTNK